MTAFERETVVTLSDGENTASIWTAQRKLITKLRKNEAATEIDSGHIGSTPWARFEIDADLISFRSKRRSSTVSEESRQALAKARSAKNG